MKIILFLLGSRPWARKRAKPDEKTAITVDPFEQQLLKHMLSEDKEDDVMSFLRSIAPQMRQVRSERQFELRMQIMQLLSSFTQPLAVRSSPAIATTTQHCPTPTPSNLPPPTTHTPQHSMAPAHVPTIPQTITQPPAQTGWYQNSMMLLNSDMNNSEM